MLIGPQRPPLTTYQAHSMDLKLVKELLQHIL